MGVLLSALIVVFAVIGLTMHRDFYAGRRRRDFFCFYTNVSNLIVLLYFALAAPRLYTHAQLSPMIPHAEFAVMMSIMLTFCVFHLVLFPPIRQAARTMEHTREYWIVYTDNLIIHYIVPLSVWVYWLFCSPQSICLVRAMHCTGRRCRCCMWRIYSCVHGWRASSKRQAAAILIHFWTPAHWAHRVLRAYAQGCMAYA